MRTYFGLDELSRFHWAVIKTLLMILSIVLISHGLAIFLLNIEGSSQIVIGFFVLSLCSAAIILAFASALRITVRTAQIDMTPLQQLLLNCYRQVPMVFFVLLIIMALRQHNSFF